MLFFTPAAFLPVGDWWYADSEIDLDFENLRYHDAGELGTDSLAAQTVLMLHMDGADAGTNFSDSTGRHFVVPSGSAQIDTAQSKFGGSSLNAGSSSDYITISGSASDFNFGTGDFTVDLFFRLVGTGTQQNLYNFQVGGDAIYVDSDNKLKLFADSGVQITGTTTLSADTWYHAALTRSSGTTRLFLDGTQEGSNYTDSNNYAPGAGAPRIPAANFNGWIDELRIIKGAAAWTSTFTPPSAPYDVGIGPYDVLSCSRASIGYAQNSAGELEAFLANQLRITDLGLLVEDARTNVVLWNRDLTDAVWTPTNITAAKDQTGPDGASNSASSITATAGNGTILQSITLASSARYQSAWVKRITGSGTVEMTMDNGATWTAITVTAAWTLAEVPTQTLANPTVGFRIVTSGDAIAVDFVQNENGTFASSPIPTTTGSATRAADAVTFTNDLDSTLNGNNASLVVDLKANDISATYFIIDGTGDSIHLIDVASGHEGKWIGCFRPGLIDLLTNGPNEPSVGIEAGAKAGLSYSASACTLVAGGALPLSDDAGFGGLTPYFIPASWFGYFRRLTAWSTRLADATLQSLTAP